ncbi:MAG: hypothetical protein EAY81_07350 [Bacteroidetes bacterium]|nr:MAG: hypothetical protein EAY81_07350 [Bacteroidota bacterium]
MLAYYQKHPLRFILLCAIFVRLISAVFSIGYGFHDDHFLVIEVSEQWTQHLNLRGWLPSAEVTTPSGHNFLYPGLHYVLFLVLNALGIVDPEIKMLIVRILHAFYSTLTVYFSFLIVAKLSGLKAAKTVGLVLAFLWCLPMLSVRNLVEMACMPTLVMATWLTLKADEKEQNNLMFAAGLIAGLAFSFRFQTVTFIGGMVGALWLQQKWRKGFLLGVGALVSITIVQCSVDLPLWGRPFAEFLEYSLYNLDNATNYINGPWYNYLLLMAGLLIPPVSFMIFRGMFESRKTYLLVILPALLFFIFHSSYPNKQERFILPVIPFFVMAGVAGWYKLTENSAYWLKHEKLHQILWKTFWVLNTILLIVLTPSSTKTSRVKAMGYLYKKECKGAFLIENSNTGKDIAMPQFYLNAYKPYYQINADHHAEEVLQRIVNDTLPRPEYVIFAEEKNLEKREQALKQFMPNITFEAAIPSSYLDRVMSWLNPVNVNQTYYIYKVNSPEILVPDTAVAN